MLVLTRCPNQRVFIKHGEEKLEIVICQTTESRVRIGFEGPRSFQITRDDTVIKHQRLPTWRLRKKDNP